MLFGYKIHEDENFVPRAHLFREDFLFEIFSLSLLSYERVLVFKEPSSWREREDSRPVPRRVIR